MRQLMWGLFDIWNGIQTMIWPVTVVITVVVSCRFFIKRISKQACYFLWLIVAIRLVCPTTINTAFSIFNVIDMLNFQEKQEYHSLISESMQLEKEERPFENWNTSVEEEKIEITKPIIMQEVIEKTENTLENSEVDSAYLAIKNNKTIIFQSPFGSAGDILVYT